MMFLWSCHYYSYVIHGKSAWRRGNRVSLGDSVLVCEVLLRLVCVFVDGFMGLHGRFVDRRVGLIVVYCIVLHCIAFYSISFHCVQGAKK